MRRLPDFVSDFSVFESGASVVFHRGAIYLHMPSVQEGQILFNVACHQSDRFHRLHLSVFEYHSRVFLDVQFKAGRLQYPGSGIAIGNDVIVVTLDVGDGDVNLRRRTGVHSSSGHPGHQRDSHVVAAGGETDVSEAETEPEIRDIGNDGNVACRVSLPDLHDASRYRVLHPLLQLPARRHDNGRQRDRGGRDVAELLPLLADTRRDSRNRHVALRVQLLHIPPQREGLS